MASRETIFSPAVEEKAIYQLAELGLVAQVPYKGVRLTADVLGGALAQAMRVQAA